jgi:UDPglucose 6-dehydrogenase
MSRGLPMLVTNAASEANAAQQARFTGRIARIAGGLQGKTVGLLGVAFKAHTDDVRYSPPLAVARGLLERGATVVAHDPQAATNARREVPELRFVDDPATALRGASIAVIGTEWPLYRDLDWAAIHPTMQTPTIVDGRRLLDGDHLRRLGFRYEAVGTASRA